MEIMSDVNNISNFHQFVISRTSEECAISRDDVDCGGKGSPMKRTEAEMIDKM